MSGTNNTNSFDIVLSWSQHSVLPLHIQTAARNLLDHMENPSVSQADKAIDLLTHYGANYEKIRPIVRDASVEVTHLAYEYLRETGVIGSDGEPSDTSDPKEFKKFKENLRIVLNIIVKTGADTIEGLIAVLRTATGEDDAWRYNLKWLDKQVDKWLEKKEKKEEEG